MQVPPRQPIEGPLHLRQAAGGEGGRVPVEGKRLMPGKQVETIEAVERPGEILVTQVGSAGGSVGLGDPLACRLLHRGPIPDQDRAGGQQFRG